MTTSLSDTSNPAPAQNTNPKRVFGKHYIVELGGCNPAKIEKVDSVRAVMAEAANRSRATVLGDHFHQFEPIGVSGFILIAESHFAVHTWPEDGYASLDIQTCGETMKAELAIEWVKKEFEAAECRVDHIFRGV
jgi:S-adenosylmethionine decarboxylase